MEAEAKVFSTGTDRLGVGGNEPTAKPKGTKMVLAINNVIELAVTWNDTANRRTRAEREAYYRGIRATLMCTSMSHDTIDKACASLKTVLGLD